MAMARHGAPWRESKDLVLAAHVALKSIPTEAVDVTWCIHDMGLFKVILFIFPMENLHDRGNRLSMIKWFLFIFLGTPQANPRWEYDILFEWLGGINHVKNHLKRDGILRKYHW